jgi:hypothetical protein
MVSRRSIVVFAGFMIRLEALNKSLGGPNKDQDLVVVVAD